VATTGNPSTKNRNESWNLIMNLLNKRCINLSNTKIILDTNYRLSWCTHWQNIVLKVLEAKSFQILLGILLHCEVVITGRWRWTGSFCNCVPLAISLPEPTCLLVSTSQKTHGLWEWDCHVLNQGTHAPWNWNS